MWAVLRWTVARAFRQDPPVGSCRMRARHYCFRPNHSRCDVNPLRITIIATTVQVRSVGSCRSRAKRHRFSDRMANVATSAVDRSARDGAGKIRGFMPQSGKLAYVITDAHQGAVTAIQCVMYIYAPVLLSGLP